MIFSTRAALTILLVAFPASAQYVASEQLGIPYPALSSGSPVTLSAIAGDPVDRGRATIPLGFTFPYYGRSYTQLIVTANGVAFLEPSSQANQGADFSSNLPLPNTSEPNGTLAPFWDDLSGRNATSALRTQTLNGSHGKGLAVEWADWNAFATSTYTLNFQIRLWADGIVEFYYGNMVGSGTTLTATVGIENGAGTIGVTGKSCSPSCKVADIATNSLITFGPAPGPDISVASLLVNSMAPAAGNTLSVSTTIKMRNFGTQPANNFTYRLYLSDDTQFDPFSDVELTPTPQGPVSIPALGALDHTVTTSVARPGASASVYVLAVVDDANVVAESNEFNNLAATSVPYSTGVDLVAQNIAGPTLGGPNEVIPVEITFSNQGIDPAGNVPVKIYLSTDNQIDAQDTVVYSGTINVAGGQNVVQTVNATLPAGIAAGNYLYILQLDDGPAVGTLVESSELNNVKVSVGTITAKQADLQVDGVAVLDATTPYAPARYAFLGEQVRLQAQVSNIGGATANPVSVAFYLSDNQTLNASTDTFIGQVTGLSFAPGQAQTVTFTATLPTTGIGGTPIAPGYYYVFARAVGLNVVEISALNNINKSVPQSVRLPSPDLLPLTVNGPVLVGSGEAMPVSCSLANVGNRAAGTFAYRYYLTANTIVTDDDVLLPIVQSNGQETSERTLSLAVGATQGQVDVVRIPKGTPPGTYYLGVLADPPGASGTGGIAEVDESNNGLAGVQVTVIDQRLAVNATTLPDAIIGLPYDVQLSATGGISGDYSFALKSGDLLPKGLSLDTKGRLTGTPEEAGAVGFTVQVTTGAAAAEQRFALRVVQVTSSIAFASTTLPPIVRLSQYDVKLPVLGGRAPYLFTVETGALPLGINLAPDGTFSGATSAPVGSQFTLGIRVRDSVGNAEQRDFLLVVADAAALLITTADLAPAKTGSQYAADISVVSATPGVPAARPITWRVLQGQLPPGLSPEPSSDDRLIISGTATATGAYAFTIEAVDARGRADTADYVLLVTPTAYGIGGQVPGLVGRGQVVTAQLGVSPMLAASRWSLRDGRLPPGLTFTPEGLITGTIPDEAEYQAYNFTVQVATDGRVIAMRSYGIQVVDSSQLAASKRCGCGAAESGLGLWALGLLALTRRRRQRS